jgi:hypothetical protein
LTINEAIRIPPHNDTANATRVGKRHAIRREKRRIETRKKEKGILIYNFYVRGYVISKGHVRVICKVERGSVAQFMTASASHPTDHANKVSPPYSRTHQCQKQE